MNRVAPACAGLPAIEGGPPVRDALLPYARPALGQAEIDEVVDTLRSGWLTTGPKAARFEQAFGRYKGGRFAAAVGSCTAGLQLALEVAGIGSGDEVVTTPMTWCATANVVVRAGARPVFADCDRRTLNIDPAEIERAIGPATRAILPVHFAGRACDMDAILAIAARHDLTVIEDCAHAIETEYHGRKAGTFGRLAAFSFYATKNVCIGEGGMVLTDDERLHERVRRLALHGVDRSSWSRSGPSGFRHALAVEPGGKSNMTDVQAAIGLHQLARVEQSWERRRAVWRRYDAAFADLPCSVPPAAEPATRHAYHLYNLVLDTDALSVDRDHVLNALMRENVGVGVHYVPVHVHPYYVERLGTRPEDCPRAAWVGGRTLSLPLSPGLSDADVGDVIEAVRKVLVHYRR
jgi:dTDP-4-amino-4,6-dideoxygalactose transaminase